jgi:uncharacterized membrane protein
MATSPERESLAALFSDLSTQIGDLIRQQAALARVEMSEKLGRIEQRLSRVAIGGVLAVAGVLTLVAALVLGLTAFGLTAWASAGIVGVVLALVGYLMVQQAMSRLNRDELTPRATIETVKESAEWVKHPTKT